MPALWTPTGTGPSAGGGQSVPVSVLAKESISFSSKRIRPSEKSLTCLIGSSVFGRFCHELLVIPPPGFSKLIGCERCMREFPCELETPASAPQDMQAYWQCEHGLWPFSERTEDCRCQTPLYRANRQASGEVASATATTRPRPGVAGSNLTLASKQPSSSAASRS